MSARRKSIRSFGSITTLNGVAPGSGLARLRFVMPVCLDATIWESLCSSIYRATFAAEIPFFDEFFRVIPGATARSHRDGNEQSGYDSPNQHSAEHHWAERLDHGDRAHKN